jgi:myo-inositol-1(or 4)-monophosphatase
VPGSIAPELRDALRLASDAARQAGRIQLDRYQRLERIVHKSQRDVVTEVDHLCEEAIIGAIRSAFPDDGIVAEESGHHRSHGGKGADPLAGTGRTWVVDPLDGTVNYANGIPIFCVSIALAIDGRPMVGVVRDPLRDETYSAVAGAGAWLDDKPIALPVKEQLSDYLVSLALPWRGYSRRERRIRAATRVSRVLGSAALSLAYVANGRFDAFIQLRGLSSWDIAAAGLIASEGGATVTDASGGPWFDLTRPDRGLGTVAAPPRHHAALLELLR